MKLTLTPRPHFISSNLVWAATNIAQNKHFSQLSLHIVVFASNFVAGAFEFALCHDSVSASSTLTNESRSFYHHNTGVLGATSGENLKPDRQGLGQKYHLNVNILLATSTIASFTAAGKSLASA